ncbi:MAG: type II secretion system F family protein [Anaerolineae bacterium]|nr:type II secretion system F family protein [Anaerolineae bacterium]
MGIVDQLFYGPNVALALLGGAGVLAMFLALFASAPAAEVRRKVTGEERRRTTLQQMIDQANLPITADEFLKTGTMLAVATAILGYVLLRTVTGAVLGGLIGPLAYWGYLGGRRDKTRRAYQEALARVATIVRDVIGRGGSLKEAVAAVAKRGPVVTQVDFEGANTALASGQSLEKGLEPLGERRRDPILTMLVEILLVHVKHGGRVKTVLDRLAAAARRRANVRRRILAEQAQLRWEARIVSIAPFVMLVIFRLSAPGLVTPFYATTAGEITVLVAGLISIVSYILVMRVGNRPLQIVESAFVASESGTADGQSGSSSRPPAGSGPADGRAGPEQSRRGGVA